MLMVVIALYLVIAPLVNNPSVFVLYAAIFMLSGPIVYFVFVHKKLQIPGMDHITKFLQQLFNVAPTDWKID